jgi:hypothetical protein
MRSLSIRGKVSQAVLAVVLFLSVISGDHAQNASTGTAKAPPRTEDIPLCNGRSLGGSEGHARSTANPHAHVVTLSWKAAVPKSNSPQEAIQGYYVYRRLTSQTYAESNRISESPVRATQCADTTVDPQKTYFYVVKAVTVGGKQSSASAEIKAVVPFP